MKNHRHSVSIPNIANYEIKYYILSTPNKYDSRVFPHHVHDRLEFYILLDGDASFSVESKIYKLNVGDIVYQIPLSEPLEEGVYTGTLVTETLSPVKLFF